MHEENLINAKLEAFYRRKLSLLLTAGMLHLIVFLSVIWISTFVADSVFFFTRSVRWFVLTVNMILSLYLFHRFIGQHLLYSWRFRNSKIRLADAAREIGFFKPEIADRMVNTYQLQYTAEKFSSPALRQYAIQSFSDKIKGDDFRPLLSFRTFTIPYTYMICIILGGIIVSSFMGDNLLVSLKRVFNPSGDYQLQQHYSFQVIPGDTTLIAGQPLPIKATFSGPSVRQFQVETHDQENGQTRTMNLERKGRAFITTLTGIHTNFTYQLSAVPEWEIGQEILFKSKPYKVTVIIPPAVNELQIAVTPPVYTQMAKKYLEPNIGDILVYKGSLVQLSARVNKEVRSTIIVFSSGDTLPAVIRGQSISAEFTAMRAGNYHIQLLDQSGITNVDPINYQIEILDDLNPTITLLDPGQDIDISPDAALNLMFEGRDDFGFSNMWLSYQIISSLDIAKDTTWRQIPLYFPTDPGKHFQQQYVWQFTNFPVGFGDAIKYYLALSDNDRISGPKTGFSGTYLINFPTIEQVFAASDQKQQESIEENEKIRDDSDRLHETLEQITREMKRDKEIDWERQKQIESVLEKQTEIQNRLEKIQENLDQAISKLDQSQMINPDILDKYQQLQQLFEDIATPELLQSMQELQDALERLDQNQIEKSLETFKLNQEKFAEQLDRTLELFRKVQFEQELDRLSQMAEKAFRNQEGITDEIIRQTDTNEQLGQQKRQDDLLDAMRENMDKLLNNYLLSHYPEAQQDLEQTESQLKSGDLEQLSQAVKNQLRDGKQNLAAAKSQDLSSRLQQINNQISNAKQKVLDTNRQNVSAQLQKSTTDLLHLSQQQENLMEKTKNAGTLSDQFRDLAGGQQQIVMNMGRVMGDIVELSRETFLLSPQIGQALAEAGREMRKSLRELENRNKTGAGSAQLQSMGALNKAAMEMQSTMEGLSASASALGFEQFIQRMQQMAGQQAQLNQEGMSLFQGQANSGMLNAGAQQRLRQMAAEQRALQQSMEQLHEEMGQRSDVIGRLDNIASEMENVVQDLEQMKLDRKTIERQQKILSRMLDAQKSMREQEYSRQRKAEVGKDYARRIPDSRQEREDRELKRLQDQLMRALQEGYTPDYEKIIEEYFRILSQHYLQEKKRNP